MGRGENGRETDGKRIQLNRLYMEEIRLLGKEDIDVRVAQTNIYNNNGQQVVKVNLLLYKDARVDMKILDELFTPMGWKRTHKLIGDRLYCNVEVFNKETGEWICKEDVGVESNTEAEKGQASDSFKRACVNWGIGRELYTAPKISVELKDGEYTRSQDGKIKVFAAFSVKSIGYDVISRTINALEIQDRFGNLRFSMNNPVQQSTTQSTTSSETSAAVRARRAAKANSPKAAEPYQPMEETLYWKVIERYSRGIRSKSGDDYKTEWQKMTHAGMQETLKFLSDVESFCAANGLQTPMVKDALARRQNGSI